jgi:hypothetical protein
MVRLGDELSLKQLHPLRVSHEQKLSVEVDNPRPLVQPMYVLCTGALWSGSIGEGSVRMTADSGGTFIRGPEGFTAILDDGATGTLPESGAFWGLADAVQKSDRQALWRFGHLECYPRRAAEAYEESANLGSGSATEKLTDLELSREDQVAKAQEFSVAMRHVPVPGVVAANSDGLHSPLAALSS